MKKKYTLVSLFSGAGGLDMGFNNAGFNVLWANDIDKDACETHKLWSKSLVVCGDIGKIDLNTVPSSDVIAGGFPCQGFSLAGPRKLDDSRNTLYKHFVNLVELKKPKIFIAENVKGLLSMGEGKIIEAIIEDFKDKGYKVSTYLVNAKDYEVPQDRQRVIIIGIRNDIKEEFVFPRKINKQISLKETFKGLDEPKDDEICMEGFSSRYMSRNRKRDWDDVSFTIPAQAKQIALHPSSPNMIKVDKDLWKFGEGKTRRLSYKEASLIQTFPKEMIFCGNLNSKYKQIGNAVPVKLAEHIAKSIYLFLEKLED